LVIPEITLFNYSKKIIKIGNFFSVEVSNNRVIYRQAKTNVETLSYLERKEGENLIMRKSYLITLVVLVLAIALALTLVACGSRTLADEVEEDEVEVQEEATAQAAAPVYYASSSNSVASYKYPTASASTASAAPASTSTNTVVNNTTNNTTNNTSSTGTASSYAAAATGLLDTIMEVHTGVNNAITEYKFGKVENAFNAMGSAVDATSSALGGLFGA